MKCIGFAEREGKCDKVAGTPWTRYWCTDCDEKRRKHITEQLEAIAASFNDKPVSIGGAEGWPGA